ncbi:ttn-1 [Pristionchus pacificus]|uniref:Immunoglobulin n=1 Tax=Pristionchus pacificus TaxID=54126 RepID=A0A2A6CGL3_PRIPA|nr:ttn-1 [Pristionchus pacificus]|eukprot:PDM77228.1 Immunoglobulin [Pristionchus pacificus]
MTNSVREEIESNMKLITGRPAPEVHWFDAQHNEITIDNKRFKIESTNDKSTLIIKSIDATDRGDFELRIKNRGGEAKCAIPIQVTDRPDPPGRPSIQDQNVDSVKILWSPCMQDGGSPVRHYIVEMKTTSSKTWVKAEVTKQPFTTLFNLVPSEKYRFRIRAENTFGISDPSEESEEVNVRDLTRQVVEPQKKSKLPEEPDYSDVDYEKQDAAIKVDDYKDFDIHRLPTDLQSKYIICEELGRGAYGTVYRAIEKATNKVWAAKMVQVRPGVKREAVLHEMAIMNKLHHDKLLHLHEAFDMVTEICLIEEFVSGGELFDKIVEEEALLSESEARDYMHQILLGVQHMHEKDIVHLDLKPENILLKSKQSTDIKIIDFGLARQLDQGRSVKLLFGTPEFCAPEVVNYNPVGLSTDMWTVGVISYVLLSGLSPFLGDNDEETLANVSAGDWDFDDPAFDDISAEAKDFICRLMLKDKRKRMTVGEALRHPWIAVSYLLILIISLVVLWMSMYRWPRPTVIFVQFRPFQGPLLSAFEDLSAYKQQPRKVRGNIPRRAKRDFLSRKRWSADVLPIGRLAKRGAIFRRMSMDGVFERDISFDTECAPTVRRRLEDIVAYVGDLLAELDCDIHAVPSPEVRWFKDRKELNVSSVKYRSTGCSLEIRDIVETDSGVYTCQAVNDLGQIESTAKLIVEPKRSAKDARKASTTSAVARDKKSKEKETGEMKYSEEPPKFHHKLSDCSSRIFEPFTLVVTNTTLPEPSVTWFRNGKEISRADVQFSQKHDKGRYTLTILRCEKEHDADYKAVGKNQFGQCESSCHLSIEIPDGLSAPKFTVPLADIKCKETEMLKLEVRISANPTPEITWYKDGRELIHSDRYRILYDDEEHRYSLTLLNGYAEESGQYRCVARNAVGQEESSCWLNIQEPEQRRAKKVDDAKAPKFRMQLPNPREVPEGGELTLVCAITGTPIPAIRWTRDGKMIEEEEGRVIRCENGVCSLVIRQAKKEDAGNYVCQAENLHGSSSTSSSVVILPPLSADVKAPRFVEQLLDSTTPEGAEVLLECCVEGKPMPNVTWYKDGLKLLVENRMLTYTDRKGFTRLNIMNVVADDAGEYCCEAVNSEGKDFTHSRLSVIDSGVSRRAGSPMRPSSLGRRSASPSSSRTSHRGEERPPVITRPLQDSTVHEGNREILELEVDAEPAPKIEWFKDGQRVSESRVLRMYFDGRVAFMKIYEAKQEHQGEYTCRVSNKLGSVESRALLLVETGADVERVGKMPQFIKKMQTAVVDKPGNSVSLSVQVIGDPRPDIVWLHNGRAIKEDVERKMRFVRLETKSTIKPTATLPTFLVAAKKKIVVEEGERLDVTSDINGQPRPEIVWYKDARPLSSDGRISLKQDGVTYSLTIDDVTTRDAGKYSITAENEKGKVQEDFDVEVIKKKAEKKEEPKKKTKTDDSSKPTAPKNAKLSGSPGTSTMEVAWDAPDGKSAATSYKVEQRAPDSRHWSSTGVTIKGTTAKITGLKPNHDYIIGVSAGSGSKWSDPVEISAKTAAASEAPKITEKLPSNLLVPDGESLSLSVAFSGTPTPSVAWYLDGKEIKDGVKTTSTSSILTLPSPSSGVYSCRLINDVGQASSEVDVDVIMIDDDNEDAKSTSSRHSTMSSRRSSIASKKRRKSVKEDSVEARKKSKMGEEPPFIMKDLTDESVSAGQPLNLTCTISGAEEVSWFRDGSLLSNSGKCELTAAQNIKKLTIHGATPSDAGAYSCVAKNAAGVAETTASVTVVDTANQAAPKIESGFKECVTALVGKNATLKCRITGAPEPQAVWSKDGTPLVSSRRVKISFGSDGSCLLTINDLNEDDTGIYVLSASNSLGVDCVQCLLTVAETAGADAHLVVAGDKDKQSPRWLRAPPGYLEAREGHPIKLVAKAQGTPTPSIKWKKDGKEITRTNRSYQQLVTGDGEHHLSVDCAVRMTAGEFECIAENAMGVITTKTTLVIGKGDGLPLSPVPPRFSSPLVDQGVQNGHPIKLSVKAIGTPEPTLSWFFISDAEGAQPVSLTADNSGWIEQREDGATASINCHSLQRSQQGTYQCVATNATGSTDTSCYVMVGGADEPAGPPRFVRCLRDIWTPLAESVVFEVEIAGAPLPELAWYHNDNRLAESKNVQISWLSSSRCELRLSDVSLRSLGTYAVDAFNGHGIVRTTACLNVGEPRHAEPPVFHKEPARPTSFDECKVAKSPSMVRMEMKKKGAAPKFVHGLEDMEVKEGASAAVAGQLAKKRQHRVHGHKHPARGLADQLRLDLATIQEVQSPTVSSPAQSIETTLEEIRITINDRNKKACRPKFIVKPKSKKPIDEGKSLRLKTAVSANPAPAVQWDRAGMVLETGNKYSIYNDGDFYYLEVHHVTRFDAGFYNCTAENVDGMATCTSEVVVDQPKDTSRRRSRRPPKAPEWSEVLPGVVKMSAGDILSVECSISGHPLPSVSWLRNGASLTPQRGRHTISYDGECATLKIAALEEADEGKYSCVAVNEHGETTCQLQLTVAASAKQSSSSLAKGIAPTFKETQSRLIKAADGQSVDLKCSLSAGSEPLQMKWMRDNVQVNDSMSFAYSRKNFECALRLADVFPEDAGDYVCERQHIELAALAYHSHPDPVISWKKGNVVIGVESEKHRMRVDGDVFSLLVASSSRLDAGIYSITAVNTAGSTEKSVQVSIVESSESSDKSQPKFTENPVTVQVALGTKAELRCRFAGSPAPTCTWFKGDYKIVDGEHGYTISTSVDASTLSVVFLEKEHIGEYLCTVRNAYGEDLATARIMIEGSSAALPKRRTVRK